MQHNLYDETYTICINFFLLNTVRKLRKFHLMKIIVKVELAENFRQSARHSILKFPINWLNDMVPRCARLKKIASQNAQYSRKKLIPVRTVQHN